MKKKKKSTNVKRSMTLSGHRTSVSLEAEFWSALDSIAQTWETTAQAIIHNLDQHRIRANGSLTSNVRVFTLGYYQRQVAGRPASLTEGFGE